MVELARQIPGAADEDARVLATKGVEAIMAGIRATLEAYRVHFDSWFLERSLHDGSPSAVERAIALLEERATPTAPRARCGCARRSSATTRTAC